ncbi:uncharacterized protein LOC116287405 [Actinia tenebrosa]|uniref:Uncharacterized protein LOC116287405 n=1 Tax=Actinia tenebrosa TaxID=6105 RepID=A0A6P8H3B5_ACTTE|nr:uncharacterized protein LOC116287405 [Actinia tenebrosa]
MSESMEVLNSFDNFVFLAFLLQLLYFANGKEILTIFRNPGNGGLWTDLDQFKLPDSKCSSSNTYCTNWKALPLDSQPCHCECSDFKKATFGFYLGSWTCLDNTEVRKQTECKYKFESEVIGYPLRIVEQDQSYNLILLSRRCSVESKTTRYFTCDGSWATIDSNSWFTITQEDKLKRPTRYRYKLTIGSDVDDVLQGRIISLNINCTKRETSCLLFKLEGTIDCAENVTFATTAKPSSPTRIASDKIPITATATATVSAVPNATAIPNESGKKEKSKASGGSSTVVGIVVTLMIILVIAILIVVYVYLKRKRGEAVWLVDYISSRRVRKTKSTQAKKKTVDEDPVYAEIPEEQRNMNAPVDQAGGIYSYAFDDPQTAYIAPQPAPYNRLEHKQQGLNQEGALYSTADDGPVYNFLERPLAENNIIMAPENTVNEGPPSQVLEPEYLVLEEPDTTSVNTDV